MLHSAPTPSSVSNPVTSFFHQNFEGDFRIKHTIANVVTGNRVHTHNFYEILLCCSHNCHVLINDTVFRVNPGTLILLNSTDVHGIIYDGSGQFDRYVLEFNPIYAQDMCKYYDFLSCFEEKAHPAVLSLDSDQLHTYMVMFQKLMLLSKPSKRPEQPLVRKLAFTDLLMHISTLAHSAAKADTNPEDVAIQRIQTIVTYINDHLSEDMTLEELSKQVFLSVSYLNAMFRSYMGCSISQYIMSQRILKATRLLQQPLTVQEVSEKCGFNNYANFIRAFKKYTGLPPGQYRKTSVK